MEIPKEILCKTEYNVQKLTKLRLENVFYFIISVLHRLYSYVYNTHAHTHYTWMRELKSCFC